MALTESIMELVTVGRRQKPPPTKCAPPRKIAKAKFLIAISTNQPATLIKTIQFLNTKFWHGVLSA